MYTPDPGLVTFIADYMNESHADALVEIARAAGQTVSSAELIDLTPDGVVLTLDGAESERLTVAWPGPLRRREDIRAYLMEMQEEALGCR